MKILIRFIFVFFIGITGWAQTAEKNLLGKWKYTGATVSKAMYKTDPKWYKNAGPTPKFEFIEFKTNGTCTYNEKTKEMQKGSYVLKAKAIIINNIEYELRLLNKKSLVLFRGYYSYKDENGNLKQVDEEQIAFEKIQ